MRFFLAVLMISTLIFSCKKQKNKTTESVEFYLLKSYSLVPGKCQVDGAAAVLEETPLVANADILQYLKTDHQYQVTDAAFKKLQLLVPRSPLAVTVDKKVIFFGIYMPPILSSTCAHSITMNLGLATINKVNFQLGYPGLLTGTPIDDQRNNTVLMNALARQGKLK